MFAFKCASVFQNVSVFKEKLDALLLLLFFCLVAISFFFFNCFLFVTGIALNHCDIDLYYINGVAGFNRNDLTTTKNLTITKNTQKNLKKIYMK